MALPDFSNLLHDGVPRTNTDWDNLVNEFDNAITNGVTDINVNAITANTYNNLPAFDISNLVAGESIAAGNGVRLNAGDGKVYNATNSSAAGIDNVLGISNAAYVLGETVIIKTDTYTGYTTLTAGTEYYVGTSGAITNTPSNYTVLLGTALNTTTLSINVVYENWRRFRSAGHYITKYSGSFTQGENLFRDRFRVQLTATRKSALIEINMTATNPSGLTHNAFTLKLSVQRIDASSTAATGYVISNLTSQGVSYGIPYTVGDYVYIPINTYNNGSATTNTLNYDVTVYQANGAATCTFEEIDLASTSSVVTTFYSSNNIGAPTFNTITSGLISGETTGTRDDTVTATTGTVDLTLQNGISYVGHLHVTNVQVGTPTIRTSAVIEVSGRITDSFAQNTAFTDNGSGGGAAFTITNPSDNVLRLTNDHGSQTAVSMVFKGATGI